MYDLKITNGRVVDFDKGCFSKVDIGIKGGRIKKIGSLTEEAIKVIDAENNIVSPGFIDIHMHEEKLGNIEDEYDIANKMCLMGVTSAHGGNCGINAQEPKEFIEFVKNNGAPINYLMSIGYNYLREKVGISSNYVSADENQIKNILKLIDQYIELGIVGISFGIEYSPGISFEEMVQVCNGIKDKNLFISAHYRSDSENALEAIAEMINLSRITGIPLQISHLGSCSAMGMMKESLRLIESAINDGVDIMVDCYPYDAFSTFIGSAVFDEGCFERWNKDYDSILVTEGKYRGERCNKELFYKVRKDNPEVIAVAFAMNEEEVIECLKAPYVFVGSDGLYNNSKGHPRGAGTFPRVLGRLVREKGAFNLIEGLKKMTIMPAKRLGLSNKGAIKEGMDADIVIFNPDKIEDRASFENPSLSPIGIDYVIVNGVIAVEKGFQVNKRSGKYMEREIKE